MANQPHTEIIEMRMIQLNEESSDKDMDNAQKVMETRVKLNIKRSNT